MAFSNNWLAEVYESRTWTEIKKSRRREPGRYVGFLPFAVIIISRGLGRDLVPPAGRKTTSQNSDKTLGRLRKIVYYYVSFRGMEEGTRSELSDRTPYERCLLRNKRWVK